jgi:hypothetical protein
VIAMSGVSKVYAGTVPARAELGFDGHPTTIYPAIRASRLSPTEALADR